MPKKRCQELNKNGNQCKKPAEFNGMCMFHFIRKAHEDTDFRDKLKKAIK